MIFTVENLSIASCLGSAFFSLLLTALINILPKNKATIHVLMASIILIIVDITLIITIWFGEWLLVLKFLITIMKSLMIIFWGFLLVVSAVNLKKMNMKE